MKKIYELVPTKGQKSFYGKAKVVVYDDGTEIMQSYDTDIVKKTPDGQLFRMWDNWSQTTGRHIAAYCGLNKKEYEALPVDENASRCGGWMTAKESYQAMMARRQGKIWMPSPYHT